MDISAIINEWGENREDYFQAMTPPIYQTSNFRYETVDAFRHAFQDEFEAYLHSRGKNPTVDILRKKLAALEGAEDCLVFNSGIAAITAAVLAQVQSGDHIVCVDQPYSWVQKLLKETLPKFGVHTSFVDGRSIDSFERAILPNTKLIYLESPNTWDFALQDLAAVAALAQSENIVTICDNSYCTGLWQQPIALGIDLTVQSATKYISGHSDTVAGVLCGSTAMIQRIFNSEYLTIGSGIQPFNAWLLIRGLRTLPIRLERVA
ncbi:MAG TPA: aminotransferase class I/II-fold pyridoxal phosphate-dependent enzyme, partial [Ferruginibacter sp.]|nr:aminotransferase class I/II-fold pyridoxal phosphate-dependent enzyme [Ferruginibacter sp.]